MLKESAITIGGDLSHTVRLPDLRASDLLAGIERRGSAYWAVERDPVTSMKVNGVRTSEAALRDGDVIMLCGTHVIRFGTVPERHESPKRVRQIVRQCWQGTRQLDTGQVGRAWFFLRDVCHCTMSDASRVTLVAWAAVLGLVAAAGIVSAVSLMQARAAGRRVVALSEQVIAGAVSRRQLEQQIARLRQIERDKIKTEAALGDISRDLHTAEQRLARIEGQTPALLASIEAARHAVALVLVSYTFHEKGGGRPLRYVAVDAHGTPLPTADAGYETSVDGTGPIVTAESTGSGFLSSGGRIITNRHVAEPWRDQEIANRVMREGFEPRYSIMRAYFPHLRRPIELRVAAVSPAADLAVLTGAVPRAVSALSFAPAGRRVSPGDPIVLVGYPTGFDALLAKADEAVAQRILERVGGDWAEMAGALASEQLITPLVTVGHVSDVRGNNIVYDAATTQGGSGGPVLNVAGEVIAVNYARLADFAGASFGIPIGNLQPLLRVPGKPDR